jgi:hypothetical protein
LALHHSQLFHSAANRINTYNGEDKQYEIGDRKEKQK